MTRIDKRQNATGRPAGALLAVVAVLCMLMAPLAVAQEPQTAVSEEIDVTEVLLDVVVTDRRGNVVVGLDEDDFVIEEDGERIQPTDVSFYSTHRFLEGSERARELGIDPEAVPVERHFILFFHDQRLLLPRLIVQQMDAGRRARQWVNTDLQPSDYVAVVAYDTEVKILQDFTNDAERLDSAIQRAVQGLDPKPEMAVTQPAGAPSMLAHFEGDPARIYDALEVVADAAGHIRGRKNLILFSVGFGRVNEFGLYSPDRRYYPDMVRALNDANVAVYTIDLIPTEFTFLRGGGLANSLSDLAADTGGEYHFNFVNFLTPLEQVTADTNGYYLLSYTSEHDDESGYQKVDVETVNPELRVRAREGYIYESGMGDRKGG